MPLDQINPESALASSQLVPPPYSVAQHRVAQKPNGSHRSTLLKPVLPSRHSRRSFRLLIGPEDSIQKTGKGKTSHLPLHRPKSPSPLPPLSLYSRTRLAANSCASASPALVPRACSSPQHSNDEVTTNTAACRATENPTGNRCASITLQHLVEPHDSPIASTCLKPALLRLVRQSAGARESIHQPPKTTLRVSTTSRLRRNLADNLCTKHSDREHERVLGPRSSFLCAGSTHRVSEGAPSLRCLRGDLGAVSPPISLDGFKVIHARRKEISRTVLTSSRPTPGRIRSGAFRFRPDLGQATSRAWHCCSL